MYRSQTFLEASHFSCLTGQGAIRRNYKNKLIEKTILKQFSLKTCEYFTKLMKVSLDLDLVGKLACELYPECHISNAYI